MVGDIQCAVGEREGCAVEGVGFRERGSCVVKSQRVDEAVRGEAIEFDQIGDERTVRDGNLSVKQLKRIDAARQVERTISELNICRSINPRHYSGIQRGAGVELFDLAVREERAARVSDEVRVALHITVVEVALRALGVHQDRVLEAANVHVVGDETFAVCFNHQRLGL